MNPMDDNLPPAGRKRRLMMMRPVAHLCTLGVACRLLPRSLLLASFGAALQHRAQAAQVVTQTREVSGFNEVVFAAAGDLYLTQGQREHLTIEAEPDVLRLITSEVRSQRLTLGFASGSSVLAREPIRFRLELRTLRALKLQSAGGVHSGAIKTEHLSLDLPGSGDIEIERLDARRLELRLSGSGNVSVRHGQVDSQRLEIGGAGSVTTNGLASRDAEVSIDGSGEVRLAASARLTARITGSGSVRFSGNPQLVESITGAGTVQRDF